MKQRMTALVVLLAASVSAGGVWAADAGNYQHLNTPLLTGRVTLDGRLHETQWRQAAVLRSDVFRTWTEDEHLADRSKFSIRVFHDGTQLYVSLSSYDRYVEPADRPEDADGLYALTLVTKQGEFQNYRLRWSANPPVAANELTVIGKWGARLRAAYGETRFPGGGYVLELALPLSALGYRAGDHIPFNIIVQDHDHNPGGAITASQTEFTRSGWPGLDSDQPDGFAELVLEVAQP